METSMKSILLAIKSGKLTKLELQVLLQFIAQELNLKTTSNYAKINGKSFNGVKNHVPYIKIDAVKFHSSVLTDLDDLPF